MSHHRFHLRFVGAVAACLLGAVVSADAATMTLDQLLVPGAMIQVGDKAFDQFGYTWTDDMPAPVQINVVPLDQGGETGLRFQGPFIDIADGIASDALLTFRVTVLGSNQIVGATLSGNPSVLLGDGTVSVTETFLPSLTSDTLDIFHITPPGLQQLTDSVTFTHGVQQLYVQKDILASAATGAATLSFIDQTFEQVPEPTSVGLLALGLVGVLLYRRRG